MNYGKVVYELSNRIGELTEEVRALAAEVRAMGKSNGSAPTASDGEVGEIVTKSSSKDINCDYSLGSCDPYFKPMEYKSKHCKPYILSRGYVDGLEYCIVSFGIYPCAYVRIPKEWAMRKLSWFEYAIDNAHCGITFAGCPKVVDNKDTYWIGWDYAHATDRMGDSSSFVFEELGLRPTEWTTEEIFDQCKSVIEELHEWHEKGEL